MEALKDILAILGSIVGVLTGLVTLYAKYMDMKKKPAPAPRADDAETSALPTAPDEPPGPGRQTLGRAAIAHARQAVRGPSIALIVAGGLSLMTNLFMGSVAFVDEFVTPFTDQTIQRRNLARARGMSGDERDPSMVMGIVCLFSFGVASGAATWAGCNMLNLRSYWLSVAGSLAVMPGACMCCLAGFPIGIWSLIVLFRSDVRSAFE
jgi:hypothetical protein